MCWLRIQNELKNVILWLLTDFNTIRALRMWLSFLSVPDKIQTQTGGFYVLVFLISGENCLTFFFLYYLFCIWLVALYLQPETLHHLVVLLTKYHGRLASPEPYLHTSGGGTPACQTGSGPDVNTGNKSFVLKVSTIASAETVRTWIV